MSNNPYIFHNTNKVVKNFFVYHQHLGVILFSDIWTQLIYTVMLSLNGITACVPGMDSYRWNYFSVCSTWMADLFSITGIQQQLRVQKMLSTLWLSMLLFAATGDNNIKVLSAWYAKRNPWYACMLRELIINKRNIIGQFRRPLLDNGWMVGWMVSHNSVYNTCSASGKKHHKGRISSSGISWPKIALYCWHLKFRTDVLIRLIWLENYDTDILRS